MCTHQWATGFIPQDSSPDKRPLIMTRLMPTQISPASSSDLLAPYSSAKRHKLFVSLIVLVWAVIYIGSLFQPPLMDDADTVHAEAAREMVEHNDWVTLKINDGFRYLEKAPLMYWIVAASYKVFGVHDWSARLPIALGMLALLLVVYRIGRRFYGDEGGLYAALALGTGFGPFIYTRFMIPEMLVALWLAMGFDFFLSSLEQSERGEQPSLLGLLGTGGNDGAQCVDQRADRFGLSCWDDLYLSAAHEKPAAPSAASAVFKLSDFSTDCSSVACAGGLAESGARRGARILLVLFCQRTFPALPEETLSGRLRHGAALAFLGTDAGLADALDGVPCSGDKTSSSKIGGVPRRAERATTRNADFCTVAVDHSAVLQLFQPTGILRASRLAWSGAAVGRMAGARVGFCARQC